MLDSEGARLERRNERAAALEQSLLERTRDLDGLATALRQREASLEIEAELREEKLERREEELSERERRLARRERELVAYVARAQAAFSGDSSSLARSA